MPLDSRAPSSDDNGDEDPADVEPEGAEEPSDESDWLRGVSRLSEQLRQQADAIQRAVRPEWLDAMNTAAERIREQVEGLQRMMQPAWLESMNRISDQIREQVDSWQRTMASLVLPSIEQWSLQLPKIDPAWIESLQAVAEQWRRAWEEALPPNWEGLDIEAITKIIQRIEVTGYCLVWAPRAAILQEVMAADEAETAMLLLSHRDEVLDDVLSVLSGARGDDLARERRAVTAAVAAYGSGHSMPAQALASSAFTSAAHLWFEMPRTSKIRQRMAETHPDDATILQLRLRTIFLAGAEALDEFRPDTASPMRTKFNRHNTAHRITDEQWTEANALSAILLAAALVRELDYWYTLEREQPAASDDSHS